MTIDEAITRYKNNAEYERTHGNLQGFLEFKQLAKWLEQLQKIEQIYKDYCFPTKINTFDAMEMIGEVLKKEDDNPCDTNPFCDSRFGG